jgi:SAM-dependent methyltransferase
MTWIPAFACACGSPVQADGANCPRCGVAVDEKDGIYRCLSAECASRLAPFLAQYRHVRRQDGYRVRDAHYYRALPDVPPGDPQAAVWRIRRRSFDRLCREVLPRPAEPMPAVLDLGAGNGWLSAQLSRRGYRVAAVDLLADDMDGLGACRHYDTPFPCVQADFDALPLLPGQFDLAIFNGSLHYAPVVSATLSQTAAMLRPGGALVVIDSPMFDLTEDGEAMRGRLRQRLRDDYGCHEPIEPGEGCLILPALERWASARGQRSRFLPTDTGWRQRVRRLWPGRPRGNHPPSFGVWVAA